MPDPAILSVSIELADHALRGLSMSRGDYAALLCEIYEGVVLGLPYKELMEFARNSAVAAGSRDSDAPSPERIQATGDRKGD